MTIDEFEKRVAETITDTKPAKVASGEERAMTDLDKKLIPHLYGLREAGYEYVVYVMQSIKSLIEEEVNKEANKVLDRLEAIPDGLFTLDEGYGQPDTDHILRIDAQSAWDWIDNERKKYKAKGE